jgi:hypothetical protein
VLEKIQNLFHPAAQEALKIWINWLGGSWFPYFATGLKFILIFLGSVSISWEIYTLAACGSLMYLLYSAPYKRLLALEPDREVIVGEGDLSIEGISMIYGSVFNDTHSIVECYPVIANEAPQKGEVVSRNLRLPFTTVRQGRERDNMAVLPPKGFGMFAIGVSRNNGNAISIPVGEGNEFRINMGEWGLINIAIFSRLEGETEFKRIDRDYWIAYLEDGRLTITPHEELLSRLKVAQKIMEQDNNENNAQRKRSDQLPPPTEKEISATLLKIINADPKRTQLSTKENTKNSL